MLMVKAAHGRAESCSKGLGWKYTALGVDFRIQPVFDAPNMMPDSPLAISNDEVVKSLCDLFVCWFEGGCRVRVFPLEDYLTTALLNLADLERPRRELAEQVLVVNTDGTLYIHNERYAPGRELGNLFGQSMDDIVGSPAYAAAVDRNNVLLTRHCQRCSFRGACDGLPVQSHPHRWPEGPCPIASRVCAFIEDYCRIEGVNDALLEDQLLLG